LHKELLEAATALLSAPLSAEGWHVALRGLAACTGASRSQIVAFGNDATVPFNVMTEVDTSWMSEFLAIGGTNPELNWRLRLADAPFRIISECQYDVARAASGNNIYDDFAIKHEMLDGCQTVLTKDEKSFFGLATMRAKADGRCDEEDLARFAFLAPFALAAVKMQISLENQGDMLLASTLEGVRAAAFLVDGDRKVLGFTPKAERLLAKGGLLRITGGRLYGWWQHEDRALSSAFERLRCADESDVETPMVWLRGDGSVSGGHRCEIFKLPRDAWAFGQTPRFTFVVRSPRQPEAAIHRLLQTALGLTKAEAEIALMLAMGLSREEVAARRASTISTVCTQIKSIFSKVDVSREVALVALVHRIIA